MKRLLIIPALTMFVQTAAAKGDSLMSGNMQNYIGYGAIMGMLVLFIIVLLILLRAFKVMTRVILRLQGYTNAEIAAEMQPVKKQKKPKKDVWLKALSLKPMSEEKSILIAHDYDGIQELDNPTPAWFMWLFYGTIAFGICYLLIYHVFGIGQLQYDEYKTEMVQADIAKKEYLSKAANRVDENTVKLVTDAGTLAAGKAIFTTTCAPCHGDHAQGNVGPNLTDDYWLHGSQINDVFKTIKYGVAAKGMPTWEKQLSPKQISDVANFVKSLHGTNPANPKAPQGEKEVETDQKLASNKNIMSAILAAKETGERKWMTPLLRKGVYYRWRSAISYVYLVFFFSGPFIRIGGQPLLLLNFMERHFVILGQVFWPQDIFLFMLASLVFLVCVVLFTIAFGRMFCGWICPQTIFMEMVFRKIEVWIEGDANKRKKLDAGPWTNNKIIKKAGKHALFVLVSFLIANTFLAYLIGSESLLKIMTEPVTLHGIGFASIWVFTIVFYLVYSQVRELVCTVICPYGRLQSVLIDEHTLVVAYNDVRGEPRGKLQKNTDPFNLKGDCVDCGLCVSVCPTGIDIRNGTQIECVNCTACIDVCDEVMDKIHKPKNLIGYYSGKHDQGERETIFYTTDEKLCCGYCDYDKCTMLFYF